MELKDEIKDTWCVNGEIDSRPSDITVCVGSCYFFSHKNVLIDNCDYFKAMFSSQMLENDQEIVTIKLFDKYPFQILIQGFYTGKLFLTSDNIFEVTMAAHILQVSEILFYQCCNFLKSLLNRFKCFEIMQFSKFHNMQRIYDVSRRYCLIHFLTLCKEESFFNLDIDEVVEYLSDDFLVADEELEKIQALADWCSFNDYTNIKLLQEAVATIIHHSDATSQLCKDIANRLANHGNLDDNLIFSLDKNSLNQDVMLFWARHSSCKVDGLVDVIKLDDLSDNSNGEVKSHKVDTMAQIVEQPGYDLGSAVCCKGPYVYVCGGGPKFGRMDWIRDVWRYSVLEDQPKWTTVAELPHSLRYHTMVPVATKLYIFGGFGKFRSKNCYLNSIDVVTGEWREHACVPKHETKPVATYHHMTIYYVCREMKVHAYNTIKNQWTLIRASDPIWDIAGDQSGSSQSNEIYTVASPLSCFIEPTGPGSSVRKFVLLSNYNMYFQTQSLDLSGESNSYSLASQKIHHDINMKLYSLIGSSVVKEKIIIVFQKQSDNEMDGDDPTRRKYLPFQCMKLSSDMSEIKNWSKVNGVQQTLSFVAVPTMPETFHISSNYQNEKFST